MEVNHAIIKIQIDLATFCQLLLCLKKRGDHNFIVYDFNEPNFYTWIRKRQFQCPEKIKPWRFFEIP